MIGLGLEIASGRASTNHNFEFRFDTTSEKEGTARSNKRDLCRPKSIYSDYNKEKMLICKNIITKVTHQLSQIERSESARKIRKNKMNTLYELFF